jgi:hypothetical protein
MSPDTYSLARMSSFRTLRISRLVLACSLAAGCTAGYTIRFTAAEIQQSLNRKLPISKSKFLVRATVQSLEVALRQGPDRILLRPQVEVSIAGQSALTGRALVEGQIRYAPDTGEFFFDAPRMVEVSVGGIPESMRQHAEDLIATCAEAYLTITPVYRLRQTDFKQSLARMLLKSVKVRDGQLQVVIGMP